MQLLVGAGIYAVGIHSEREFMQVDAYNKRLILLTHLLNKLTD